MRREILTLDANPRSPERGQWGFVQGLIREVAYSTLSKKDRRARHLAAARYFESLGDEEIAGALASHYLAAYRASPEGPEGEALAGQARISLKAAADRATRLGAHTQAVAFLEEALTVTADPAEEAEILLRAGQAAGLSLRFDDADRLLGRAIERYRELGDRPGTVRAITALGRALLTGFQGEKALALLEPAEREFADLGEGREWVALLGQLARAYQLQEKRDQAITWADRALDTAERLGDVELVADALITKGSAMVSGWRTHEGLALLDGAERLARSTDLVQLQLRARLTQTAYLFDRDPRATVEIARESIELARRYGLASTFVLVATNGIEAAFRTGEWQWALGELGAVLAMDLDDVRAATAQALRIAFLACQGEDIAEARTLLMGRAPEDGSEFLLWGRRFAEAWAAYAAGDDDAAYRAWMAIADVSPLNEPPSLAFAARAALRSGQIEAARGALDRLDGLGARGPAVQADRAVIRAGLAAREGRRTDAVGGYRDTLRQFRDLGLDFDVALGGLDFLTFLPEEPEARAAAEESRAIFERLGARPFLERLQAAVASAAKRAAPASRPLEPSTQAAESTAREPASA